MFILREKPIRPVRKLLESFEIELSPQGKRVPCEEIYGEEYEEGQWYCREDDPEPPNLQEVVDFFISNNCLLRNTGYNPSYYHSKYEIESSSFRHAKYESSESYNRRLQEYEVELKAYNKWKRDNKEQIKAHKAMLKEQIATEKLERRVAAKREKLDRQREKTEELERLLNTHYDR